MNLRIQFNALLFLFTLVGVSAEAAETSIDKLTADEYKTYSHDQRGTVVSDLLHAIFEKYNSDPGTRYKAQCLIDLNNTKDVSSGYPMLVELVTEQLALAADDTEELLVKDIVFGVTEHECTPRDKKKFDATLSAEEIERIGKNRWDFSFLVEKPRKDRKKSTPCNLPGCVLPAKATDPTIALPSQTIRPGEPFTVTVRNLPGNPKDWLTLVPRSAPTSTFGDWFYTKGVKEGTWKFTASKPGEYEVRVYFDWPNGKYIVRARKTLVAE